MRPVALVLLVSLASPMVAVAQAASAAGDEEARMRFELGQRYYEQGRFAEAATEFERAYAASARDALIYNVFIAHRDAGNDREAADALRRYLATSDPTGDRRTQLEARLATLERRLAGEAVPDEGDGGGTSPLVVLGGAVAGLGGAALIASVVTGVLALDGEAYLDGACPGGVCSREDQGRIDETHTLGVATDVLWVSGAVAVGAGVAILVVGLVVGQPSGAAANVSPTFACASDGCVAGATGRF